MARATTTKQIAYIKDLAEQAGYTGDRGYNAANDLLGDGRGWKDDSIAASRLIDLLIAKIAAKAA